MTTTLQTNFPTEITLTNYNTSWGISSYSTNITGMPTFTSNNMVMSIPANGNEIIVEPAASLNVKGTIIMNGEDLSDRLERIETLLNIPSRDIEMEKEFSRLKQLWEEYNLELEKCKTWKRLIK